jgi:pimeloyl-ACP methyl ester carboxylesterase
MNTTYFKPPFRVGRERDEVLISEILRTEVGAAHPQHVRPWFDLHERAKVAILERESVDYPPPSRRSVRPVRRRCPLAGVVAGADDRMVSDTSAADFGYLGSVGMVPDWPGEEVYPPQPMFPQIRAILDRYAAGGGRYREEVFADCGHTPHVERAGEFRRVLADFLP